VGADLVSVIVPTHDRADCVTRAVDSALAQTHADVEIIVVDDGSTDDTRAVVLDTYRAEPRVRYAHQPNRGVSAARNHGIRLVRGAYAALLDSDDAWEPWKLELQLACLRAFPDAGMVWTDMLAVSPGGDVVSERFLRRFYGAYRWFSSGDLFDRSRALGEIAPGLAAVVGDRRAYAGEIYAPMVMGNLVHTSTVLLRRERLAAAGLFDESRRSGEDHDFHLRTCRAGRVAFADVDSIRYQTGRADALTQPKYSLDLATSYLDTLTGALARDRDRIRLPQGMIEEALADAHRWVGEALLSKGRRREAREHLLRSLWHAPRQPRLLGWYAGSWLPPAAYRRVLDAYRRARRRMASVGRATGP